jgi:hypothetical protein
MIPPAQQRMDNLPARTETMQAEAGNSPRLAAATKPRAVLKLN